MDTQKEAKAMEWKEISCPGCGEKMQAPENRDRIICMFCGKKIFLGPDKGKGGFEPDEFPSRVREVFVGFDAWLERFSYEEYPVAFDDFCRHFGTFLEQLEGGILQQEGAFVRDTIIEQGKALLAQISSKNRLRQTQYRLNSYMAVYLFPAALHIGGEDVRPFCLELAGKWTEVFSDSRIRVADYDTIYRGFKRKLCYITTAACLALGKGEDCEEVRRLKEYRDNFLLKQPQGEILVKEYYNIAPTIVKRIEKSAEGKKHYLKIWNTFLKPCLQDLEQGKKEKCTKRYQKMVEKLMKEYVKDWN